MEGAAMLKKLFVFLFFLPLVLASSHEASAANYLRWPEFIILDKMGGSFYEGPQPTSAIVPGNLGGVIRRGGAHFDTTAAGRDVSFILALDNGWEIHDSEQPSGKDLVLIPGWDEVFELPDQSGYRGFEELSVGQAL
jgi:hypothetical protein